ncbi:NUDIX domain-containing protein [Salinibaculum salinum]|uniref:NUDIX domain-containing protein n=1 Tax=Salinibaculum salinum TaxID=3131996 RepID=UPI0030EC18FB
MDVHDEFIPEETFGDCLAHLPQVCVEVVVSHDDGVVLARRTNEPAAGEWFWPGGRLYKGEQLTAAAERIAREELDISVSVERRLGVHAHFWDTASVAGADSRHTVNVVFLVTPAGDLNITLDSQHDEWRVVRSPDPSLHDYVSEYITTYNLL